MAASAVTRQVLSFDDSLSVTPNTDIEAKQNKKRHNSTLQSSQQRKHGKQEAAAAPAAWEANQAKYTRGEAITQQEIQTAGSSKLKNTLKQQQRITNKSITDASRYEILLPTTAGVLETNSDIVKTWQLKQSDITQMVDVRTQAKQYDISMEFGPYKTQYTRNGRYLLTAGRRGHLSIIDTHTMALQHEMHVKESVYDITWLHNETMFAVAQKQYTYIYDNTGMELHCLRNHKDVTAIDYLPYHFLLVSVGRTGYLKYQDISTGAFVVEHRTKLGSCSVLTQNKHNAIMQLGHSNGQVSLWSPNMASSLVNVYAHAGGVTAVAVAADGNTLVTSGVDNQVKVWDLRTYKCLHSYFTPKPTVSISISDNNMMALGNGHHVAVWKDAFKVKAKSPYLSAQYNGNSVSSVCFQPYEDVLSVGHTAGIASMIVPGAGEPNYDSLAANPYETKQQRREATVHQLLDKLKPDMITLDTNLFGTMSSSSKQWFDGARQSQRQAAYEAELASDVKNKTRGKNSSAKRFARKHGNITDKQTTHLKDSVAKAKKAEEKQRDRERLEETGEAASALKRFV